MEWERAVNEATKAEREKKVSYHDCWRFSQMTQVMAAVSAELWWEWKHAKKLSLETEKDDAKKKRAYIVNDGKEMAYQGQS